MRYSPLAKASVLALVASSVGCAVQPASPPTTAAAPGPTEALPEGINLPGRLSENQLVTVSGDQVKDADGQQIQQRRRFTGRRGFRGFTTGRRRFRFTTRRRFYRFGSYYWPYYYDAGFYYPYYTYTYPYYVYPYYTYLGGYYYPRGVFRRFGTTGRRWGGRRFGTGFRRGTGGRRR